ncbi:hypothetical protein Tco_1086281 [Tanacetum coccineum]
MLKRIPCIERTLAAVQQKEIIAVVQLNILGIETSPSPHKQVSCSTQPNKTDPAILALFHRPSFPRPIRTQPHSRFYKAKSNLTHNEEFQEVGSIAAFKVLETQFQMFIKSRIYLDDKYVVMTRNYFLQYTQLDILEFCDTLIQHMESVKKSIDERTLHKREYDNKVNDREMQTTEGKVDTCKALDASLVNIASSETESVEQDTSSISGNDAHVDDADIRPIYDEEPMAEVHTTAEINVFAPGQQHTEQPEFNNEGEVDQNAEQCHDTYRCPISKRFFKNGSTLC